MLTTGADWPPDRCRIDDYRRYQALYDGDHREAFKEKIAAKLYNRSGDGLTRLALDYPRTIVDIPADLLVGAPPVISYTDPELNAAWQKIAERSRWDAILLELVQDTGMRGDGVIQVRRSAEGAIIEPKPAYCYFPVLSPDNVRIVLEEALAWRRPWGDEQIVRVDRFIPGDQMTALRGGRIIREAYYLDGTKLGDRLAGAALLEVLGQGVPETEETGVERSTLVHLPNTRSSNSFFGRSDLGGGLPTLFEEADERLSQIARILDKHADPKMAGPGLAAGPNGVVNLAESNYFALGPNQDVKYVTWNAELNAAFQAYEAVKDEIFRHSQISPLLAGYVNGASYDSGRAYKMQLAPTLAKTMRKGLYLDAACREIVRLAVALELDRSYAETPAPNIRWRDGLPKDLQEMAQTNATRIASGTLSRLSAVMLEMDCDEQTAAAELAEIEAEALGAPPPPEIQTTPTPESPVSPGSFADGSGVTA